MTNIKTLWKKYTRTQEQRVMFCTYVIMGLIGLAICIAVPPLFIIGLFFLVVILILSGIGWLISLWVKKGDDY